MKAGDLVRRSFLSEEHRKRWAAFSKRSDQEIYLVLSIDKNSNTFRIIDSTGKIRTHARTSPSKLFEVINEMENKEG